MADEIQGKKPIQLWEDLTRRENQLTNDHVLMSQKTTGSPEEPVKVIKQEHALHPSTSKSDVVTDSEDLIILAGTGDSKTAKKVKPSRVLATKLDPPSGNILEKSIILQNKENSKAESMTVQDLFYQAQQATADIYGLKFRDINGDYEYIRTGNLAGIETTERSIITYPVNETLLSVHNKMRRCVLKSDGTVNYYLDPQNSMYKADDKVITEGEIDSFVEDYQAGSISITPKSTTGLTSAIAGSYIEVYGGALSHYALITGFSEGKIILSHPHYNNWGAGATNFRIGNAKLDGRDGQVMVEIPGFYHSFTQESDAQGYIWHHHQISMYSFSNAKYYKKRFVSAFEGVAANDSGTPSNGWNGTAWNPSTGIWTFNTDYIPTNKLLSVAGYYPISRRTRAEFRSQSANTGPKYFQYDFETHFVLQLLLLIETGGFGSQQRVCPGLTAVDSGRWSSYNAYNPIRKSGDTIPFGNMTSVISGLNMKIGSVNDNITSFSYRGIENFWGHLWKWVDCINLRWFEEGLALYAKAYISNNSRTFIDNSDAYPEAGVKIYTHKDRSIDRPERFLRAVSKEFLPTLIPSFSTDSNQYVKDYFYFPSHVNLASQYRVLAAGGSSHLSSHAGAWCVYSYYGSTSANGHIGGRLCCFGEV